MEPAERWLTVAAAFYIALIILFLFTIPVRAHDHSRPELDEWYRTLMMPDNPAVRCCGEDDEYRCEAFVRDGETWCRITDDRVNPRRPFVALDTEIFIPRHKYKFDQGNPTGSTVVFGRPSGDGFLVYCFVQGTGI